MKGLFIAIILLVALAVGGYFGFKYLGKSNISQPAIYKSEPVKVTGILNVGKGDDYEHTIMSEGKLIGVNSYTVQLKDYVGQKVEMSGQYSGTTLFADEVVSLN